MTELRIAHTSWLTTADHGTVRDLLDEAFDGNFTDEDYEHGLGGMHVLVWDGSTLVAHGSVVMRRLLHARRPLRTGYVEAVAVRTDQRGRGYGHAVMAALEEIIQGGYEIGALSTSAPPPPPSTSTPPVAGDSGQARLRCSLLGGSSAHRRTRAASTFPDECPFG